MVSNLYEGLLQELGKVLGLALVPDANNSCLVRLPNGLEVQFELDQTGDRFIMGTDLGAMPSGRYRELMFREALKANGMPAPRPGILAYSKSADRLILFRWLLARELNGEKIAFLLGPFSEKALEWREAIRQGDVPQFQATASSGPSRMFGIR